MTVGQAVTMAGGVTPKAEGAEAKIFRFSGKEGGKEILSVNLYEVAKGNAMDIYLKENDIVMVPKSGVKSFLIEFRDTVKGLLGFGFSLGSLVIEGEGMQQISYDQNYQALPPSGYSYSPPQEEKEVHLRDYWRVIRKRQWTVIAFFLIVLITTAIATYTMKPVYRGTVTIQIDKEYPNIVDFKEIFSVNMWDLDYYQTQYKILESRTLAKRVVQSLKLAEHPEFQPQPETPFQKWKSNLFNSVFGLFKSSKKEDKKTTPDVSGDGEGGRPDQRVSWQPQDRADPELPSRQGPLRFDQP